MASLPKTNHSGTVVRVMLVLLAALVLFALVTYSNRSKASERFNASMPPQLPQPQQQQPVSSSAPRAHMPQVSAAVYPMATDMGSNDEMSGFRPVGSPDVAPRQPKDAFPQDSLSPEDLLPRDAANSRWAQANPAGTGDVKDQNFLSAGFHVGIDTVGQSLRNASHDLRSVIPCPQYKVSIWQNSTIEPDLNRRPLE